MTVACAREHRGGEDQDCCVQHQGDRERRAGVDRRCAGGRASIDRSSPVPHQVGVKIEVVGHHRGSHNPHGHVQSAGRGQACGRRLQPLERPPPVGVGHHQFRGQAAGDHHHKGAHHDVQPTPA